MLIFNVASLLRAAPGTSRTYPVDVEQMPIAEDVSLAAPIAGEVRLARTGRSILATADLSTAIESHCSRCLRRVVEPISVRIEEEALPSIDIESGQPVDQRAEPDVLRLDQNHELDLAQPVREAISLAEPINVVCRPDCPGLCSVCGVDLNEEPVHQHDEEQVDPRLAALAEWRERSNPH
ncbi:MAG TPA: DUF177 domain-containing protein [Candidatus Limnocylindrales bacterium]|nr:DUF177 domain-containing protein [Candidatus Limnocylindrales bacterium]